MSIYVVGSSKNKFLPLNDIRTKFIIDEPHDGANIDFLNPWYCELTGLYYMWRHCTDDIVGLEHYRRYFVNNKRELLTKSEIQSALSTYDIILRYFECPRHQPTNWLHMSNPRKPFLQYFLQSLDDEYRDYITNAIYSSHILAQCNMFICKRPLLHEYCSWLFPALSKIPFDYFRQSSRIIGYLAEFCFLHWVTFHNKKILWGESITCH